MTPIIEGDLVKLTGKMQDPGRLDTQSLQIDWGDGITETISLAEGTTDVQVQHRYANDGNFQIQVTVTDDDGGIGIASTAVVVTNAAPALVLSLDNPTIDENEGVTVTGIVTDAGVNDSHTVSINWGDGSASETLPVTGGMFTATHTYVDDNPTATASDTFTITATVIDTADAASTATANVVATVNDVVPQITSAATDAGDFPNAKPPNENVTLNATFTEIGPGDTTFTYSIDWGDGSPIETNPTASYNTATRRGSLQAAHSYATDGLYQVRVIVTDDDTGASEVAIATAVVATPGANAAPTLATQAFEIAENSPGGTVVGTIVANDINVGETLRFTASATVVTGTDSQNREVRVPTEHLFVINESNGQITLATGALLDYETRTSYTIPITVSDRLGAMATADITVNVLPISEFDPSVVSKDYIVSRFAPNGLVVGALAALDLDQGETFTYAVPTASGFGVNSSGQLTVADATKLDFDVTPRITVPVTVTDSGGRTGTGFVYVSAAASIGSVVIDDGSVQRSSIRSITVNFDAPVVFDAGAFELKASDGTPVSVTTDVAPGTTTSRVVLTFPAALHGSLADGDYRLRVLGDRVRDTAGNALDGDRNGTSGGTSLDEFYRLHGDANGDGFTDFLDFSSGFLPAFGSARGDEAYKEFMDYDNDGNVDFTDFSEGFLPNFGKSR